MTTDNNQASRLRRTAAHVASFVAALLGLAGCQSIGALSTAASMLVEVDVYKGPLGSGKTIQLGELAAIFDQADHMLGLFVRDATAVCRDAQTDFADRQRLCDAAARAQAIRGPLSRFPSDARLRELDDAAAKVLEYQEKVRAEGSPAAAASAPGLPASEAAAAARKINRAAMEASRLATQLKVEAFYWSEVQIGRITRDSAARALLVGYVNLASELANQISARTVAIDKQLDQNVPGNALALSDHLKEAGPSDFLHLYDWYEATLPDPLNELPPRLSAPDRARLAKRLFSDHYWTRINQVHASGQGDVRMALIKDDIGNWNLKSFDNDAEQLLGAYRSLTLAGVEAGIRVAKEVDSGGSAAGLDLVSRFARGRLGSTETATLSAQRIDAMRAGVAARLEKIRAEAAEDDAKEAPLEKAAADSLAAREREKNVAQDALGKASPADRPAAQRRLEDATEQEKTAAAKLSSAQSQRREKMAVAFENAKRELEVHRRVIDSLKEFQVTTPSSPTTPRTLTNALRP